MTSTWYPLKLSVPVRRYAFGDRLIPDRLGKEGLPDGVVAETWEISDHDGSIGTVLNGSRAGRTLRELVDAHPDELVGVGWRGPHFPLLVKFLDASHRLPVHLHADDATARRVYGEPNGKSEAWHVLWAAPGASVLVGVREGATEDDLVRAFRAQDYDAVMHRFPVASGDTVYVPGGVLHTFGPDTLILEVQQTSDLGNTVMPTDLYGEPHPPEVWSANIRTVLDELRTDYQPRPTPGLAVEDGLNRRVIGCAGPHFALERWTLRGTHLEADHPRRCLTLSNVGAPVSLEHAGGRERLARGESCILPAAVGEVRVLPGAEEADLVACYVPDLARDVVEPLRDAWYGDDEIAALGEVG